MKFKLDAGKTYSPVVGAVYTGQDDDTVVIAQQHIMYALANLERAEPWTVDEYAAFEAAFGHVPGVSDVVKEELGLIPPLVGASEVPAVVEQDQTFVANTVVDFDNSGAAPVTKDDQQ